MKTPSTAPSLKTLTATEAKAGFSALLFRAGYQGERIVIKKGTRSTAVILGYEDFQRMADLEDRFESVLLTRSLKEERLLTLAKVTRGLGRS